MDKLRTNKSILTKQNFLRVEYVTFCSENKIKDEIINMLLWQQIVFELQLEKPLFETETFVLN